MPIATWTHAVTSQEVGVQVTDASQPQETIHQIIPHDSLPPEAQFPPNDPDHPDTSAVRKQLRNVSWVNRLLFPAPRMTYTAKDVDIAWSDFAIEKSVLPPEWHDRFRHNVTNWVYRHVVAVTDDDMGRCGLFRVRYDTLPGLPPVKVPTRRMAPANIAAGYETLDSWIKANNVQPSTSPFSFPPVFVPKRDGRTRVCIDYRQLNNMTIKDSFPLPRIDDLLSSVGSPKWFCTFDLQSGFMQMENDPETAYKTAFSLPGRHYHFNVLPFGVSNGPGCFQRLMTIVLEGLLGEYCLCFIDDIIIMADTLEQLFLKMNILMDRLELAGLKIRAKKAKVFRKKVVFLGYELAEDGIRPDPEKVRAVVNWPTPTTYYHVRQLVGFFNFNSASLKDLAISMRPISSLLQGLPTGAGKRPRSSSAPVKETDLIGNRWGPDQDAAFLDLKTAITNPPVLAYPDPYGLFLLMTDASRLGIGAQLSQRQGDRTLPIAFISRPCNSAEQNYAVTKLEMLAVVYAVRKLHVFLIPRRFVLLTDHQALTWLFISMPNPEGILARWITTLMVYDIAVKYRPGIINQSADALSRREYTEADLLHFCEHPDKLLLRGRLKNLSAESSVQTLPVLIQDSNLFSVAAEGTTTVVMPEVDWLTEQVMDLEIQSMVKYLTDGETINDLNEQTTEMKRLWSVRRSLIVDNKGVLKHLDEEGTERYVVP